jgi:hypothetical protein
MNNRLQPLWMTVLVGIIAAGSLANAGWLLVEPRSWYETIPGVADFGPYNEHFARDIGCIYLTAGLALTWAVFSPRHRSALVTVAAVFHGAHAAIHVFDTARGHVASHHWWLDAPTIYLPSLLLAVVAVSVWRTEPRTQ